VSAEIVELYDEQLLCSRARAGDRTALGQLLRRHGPRLYRSVLLPRLGNRGEAEEALGTTYAKVIERFSSFEWQARGLYPWLRTIAFHVAIDILRRRKRERLFEPAQLEAELERGLGGETEPSKELEERDLATARARVEHLLAQLNPRYKRAIQLRVLEGKSRDEAAALLEVSVATFDVILHRAVAKLREALSRNDDGDDHG